MVTLGVIALVVAALAFVTTLVGFRSARPVLLTCGQLARHSGRAVVSGVVEPLPDGLVCAPVSGRECVWFSSTVVEYWVERDREAVRDFDGDGPLHHGEMRPARRGRSYTETRSSQRAFLLRDASGAVEVDPGHLRPHRLPVSVRDSVNGDLATAGAGAGATTVDFAPGAKRLRRASRYDRCEIVLVPGERVFILGQIVHRRDGTVALGGRSATVSRRSPTVSARLPALRARAGWTVGALAGIIGVAALVAGTARH